MSTKQKMQQAGIISLMVTFIMMVVISLIILGFSEATRRNSREALDRQISTQAYYAAESGINDALQSYIANQTLAGTDNTDCKSFMTDRSLETKSVLDATSSIRYNCLLVTDKLSSLALDQVKIGESAVQTIHTSAPSGSMTVSWKADGNTSTTGCPARTVGGLNKLPDAQTFTAAGTGCAYAMLRMDIVPEAVTADAQSLADATRTLYLKPTKDIAMLTSVPLSTTGQPTDVWCEAATGTCRARLTGLSALGTNYYLRISSIYNNAKSVTLSGLDSGGLFVGSQLQIDATGQAQDQVRRVRVRVPLSNNGTIPANAVSASSGICKRFITLGNDDSKAIPDYNADQSERQLCRDD